MSRSIDLFIRSPISRSTRWPPEVGQAHRPGPRPRLADPADLVPRRGRGARRSWQSPPAYVDDGTPVLERSTIGTPSRPGWTREVLLWPTRRRPALPAGWSSRSPCSRPTSSPCWSTICSTAIATGEAVRPGREVRTARSGGRVMPVPPLRTGPPDPSRGRDRRGVQRPVRRRWSRFDVAPGGPGRVGSGLWPHPPPDRGAPRRIRSAPESRGVRSGGPPGPGRPPGGVRGRPPPGRAPRRPVRLRPAGGGQVVRRPAEPRPGAGS